MLQDIPYETLKQDKRAYEIMLLHDQYGNAFSEIAKVYEISAERTFQIYHKIKCRQLRLYIRHIAIALGHETLAPTEQFYRTAYDFYWDKLYTCAYMEQKYRDILTEYRAGEPGMPEWFTKTLPPFQKTLSPKTVASVVEMREKKHASFQEIADALRLTRAKAKRIYDLFYHKQVLEIVRNLQEKAETPEEKREIRDRCFAKHMSPKRRYELLTKP